MSMLYLIKTFMLYLTNTLINKKNNYEKDNFTRGHLIISNCK